MEISFIIGVAVLVKVARFVRNVSGDIVSKMWYYDNILVVEDLRFTHCVKAETGNKIVLHQFLSGIRLELG